MWYSGKSLGKITSLQIQLLDTEDLQILKNSVYAKLNYEYKSAFYQAYFMLFEFHNVME